MKRFISEFGKKCIKKVLSDREFVGKKGINWLKNEVETIKKNTLAANSRLTFVQVQKLFWLLKSGENLTPKGNARKIHDVYLTALHLEDGTIIDRH